MTLNDKVKVKVRYTDLVKQGKGHGTGRPMPVPGLSLLGLKRIRGFASILRYINPTIIIIIIIRVFLYHYTHMGWA